MDSQTKSSQAADSVAALKGIPTREDLINLLENNVVKITFNKLNGDQRVMPCTLMKDRLPTATKTEPLSQKKVRELSDKVIPVWAIESNAFRSFRYDRVTDVEVLGPYPIIKGDGSEC